MPDKVDEIISRLAKQDLHVKRPDVEKRFKLLTEMYKIPEKEAANSTANYFLKEAGIAPAAKGPMQKVKVEDIVYGGMWVEMDAKVVKLQQPKSSSVRQTGFLADDTGLIRFTLWTKAGKIPDLIEGGSYHFEGLASDEYNGRYNVKISKATKVKTLDYDLPAVEYSGDTEDVKVEAITEVGKWVNLEVKVVRLWESKSDSIDQSGIVGDETGSIKFVKWSKAKIKEQFEEGKSYRIENVVTDEYEGKFSIKMNKNSTIKLLDRDVEALSNEVEFSGAVVALSDSSGLIKRCPTCKAAIQKNTCAKHGKVTGVADLRVLASIDDGNQVLTMLLNKDQTEKLLEADMKQLQGMVREALDNRLPLNIAESKLLGRYWKVTGSQMDDLIIVSALEAM